MVKDLPTDKAPCSHGFNDAFVACGDISSKDFYRFIEDFYHGKVNLFLENGHKRHSALN